MSLVLLVACTIGSLAGSERIGSGHVGDGRDAPDEPRAATRT
jgi:hypothetical protein